MEIERKFIVAEYPANKSRYPWSMITQGYMAILGDGTEFRLRKENPRLNGGTLIRRLARAILRLVTLFFYKPDKNRYSLTVKGGGGKMRKETEIEITAQQFDALWPLTEGKQIRKIRHRIPHGRLTAELDIYIEPLDGLAIAEVEFKSEKASNNFTAPDWFGREVTDDKRYKNQNLAVHGLPK